jgi:predicted acetylornithine/succinylornithine family transaminase
MTTEETIKLSQHYVMDTYARFPVCFVRGAGCYLWDAEGKKYLDWVGGIAVNALGHAHPAIVETLSRQAATLMHTSNLFFNAEQARLAQRLCELSFADKAFFCNSGAEANEAACKLARRWGKETHGEDCYEIITLQGSFHGRTLAMVAATGQEKVQKGFAPLPEGFRQVPFGDLAALEQVIDKKTCAVMVEPILGEGGVLLHPEGFLKAVKKLCQDRGILLIFDEIQTGMGRTGTVFAYEQTGVIPDIMTLAKALGAGFPIGACLATDAVAKCFHPGQHASTFGGNQLASAVAIRFLQIISDPNFLETVRDTGNFFEEQLKALQGRKGKIQAIRRKGLMVGVDLSVPAKPLVEAGLKEGLILNSPRENTLRFVPPLILKKKQVEEGIEILEDLLATL